jgi:hypothetical protein
MNRKKQQYLMKRYMLLSFILALLSFYILSSGYIEQDYGKNFQAFSKVGINLYDVGSSFISPMLCRGASELIIQGSFNFAFGLVFLIISCAIFSSAYVRMKV